MALGCKVATRLVVGSVPMFVNCRVTDTFSPGLMAPLAGGQLSLARAEPEADKTASSFTAATVILTVPVAHFESGEPLVVPSSQT